MGSWFGVSNRSISALKSYSTTFPGTENPISEGGVWTNGGSVGLDWTDVRTGGGFAYGTQTGTGGSFDDSIACLSGFRANHTVTIVVRKSGSELPVQEVEALLRSTIVAHSATQYECLIGVDGGYTQLVRWNGPNGVEGTGFDYIIKTGPTVTVNDGSVIVATISGSLVTVTIDGNNIFTPSMIAANSVKNSTAGQPGSGNAVDVQAWAVANGGNYWATGNPGLGFYTTSGQTSAYCAKSFSATSQP